MALKHLLQDLSLATWADEPDLRVRLPMYILARDVGQLAAVRKEIADRYASSRVGTNIYFKLLWMQHAINEIQREKLNDQTTPPP